MQGFARRIFATTLKEVEYCRTIAIADTDNSSAMLGIEMLCLNMEWITGRAMPVNQKFEETGFGIRTYVNTEEKVKK